MHASLLEEVVAREALLDQAGGQRNVESVAVVVEHDISLGRGVRGLELSVHLLARRIASGKARTCLLSPNNATPSKCYAFH